VGAVDIPDEVRRFILTSIPSIPHLEALLLLCREADSSWTAASLAARLYIAERTASEVLTDLSQAGFLADQHESSPTFRYSPGSASQADLVSQTAEAYAVNLIEVTKLIHDRSVARVQEFADAFRFRKE